MSIERHLHNEFMRSDRAQALLRKCMERLTAAINYEGGTLLSSKQAAEHLGVHPDAIMTLLMTRDLFALVGSADDHLGRNPGIPSWLIHAGQLLPGIPAILDRLAMNLNDHHLRAVCFFSEANDLLSGRTPVECLREGLVAQVTFAAGEWSMDAMREKGKDG